jgi:hypothetical protein
MGAGRSDIMTMKRATAAVAAFFLAAFGSAATAEEAAHWSQVDRWRATHEAIYGLENRIALLEANPQVDDGYRAPIISHARAEIRRLRASLPPAHWQWTVPCCYSRKPIHIR